MRPPPSRTRAQVSLEALSTTQVLQLIRWMAAYKRELGTSGADVKCCVVDQFAERDVPPDEAGGGSKFELHAIDETLRGRFCTLVEAVLGRWMRGVVAKDTEETVTEGQGGVLSTPAPLDMFRRAPTRAVRRARAVCLCWT